MLTLSVGTCRATVERIKLKDKYEEERTACVDRIFIEVLPVNTRLCKAYALAAACWRCWSRFVLCTKRNFDTEKIQVRNRTCCTSGRRLCALMALEAP